ncbi:hypothetical protein [Cytobacillus oceanisediminis]|uniref:hypothetical protein n=1 Tax=Cytobacillus oceanisediminis TaxID=665099 RepID=UPI00254B95D1|nr:hypothetical protein [Cytobacillus oceanisediminis]MDK7667383.1 hypothetical protein [Cytobacillus oceanisediminis]
MTNTIDFKLKTEENKDSHGETLHHFTYFTKSERKSKLSLIVPWEDSIFKVTKKIIPSQMEYLAKKARELDSLIQSNSYPEPDRLEAFKKGTLQEAGEIFSTFIPLEEERNYIEQFICEATGFLYHQDLKQTDYTVYVVPSRIGGWEPYVSKYIRPFIQVDEEAILVERKHFHHDRYSYLITFKGGLK